MRELELNENLLAINAQIVRKAKIGPRYRRWPIYDRNPATQRATNGGASIELEILDIPAGDLAAVLMEERPELCNGKIEHSDRETVIGGVDDAALCEGHWVITQHGGWRMFCAVCDTTTSGITS